MLSVNTLLIDHGPNELDFILIKSALSLIQNIFLYIFHTHLSGMLKAECSVQIHTLWKVKDTLTIS